ncbi:MAG TPA: hypothetical protein VD828_00655 [Candidatus Nitrosotenuis sp.]|nr:hypothetical protein [Candidatus Nitrosotenuis sp.]
MSLVFDKFITALFVIILGSVWFLTRHYESSHPYKIVTYDIFGNQVRLEGIRTTFNTHSAAISFTKHYREILPHYDFTLKSELPDIKRGLLPKKTQI